MNNDTYHDDLTAHLAAQEHPQPHPKRYDHGYISHDMRLRDFGLATPEAPQKPVRKSPGPITMHEPRVDWLGWVMFATGVLSAAVGVAIEVWGKP